VPVERVRETAEVLTAMDARVDLRVYPGMGHTVSWEELKAVRAMMADVVSRP
jgi:phospholipase/carboxylesterase